MCLLASSIAAGCTFCSQRRFKVIAAVKVPIAFRAADIERRQSPPCHLPGERVEALYNGKWYGCTVVRMRATDADVAVDGGEWTVEVATEMRAATAAVPSQTQQLAEVSGLRWVGETPPAIAIAECEKAEGARAEGGERKRKREGCGL